MTLRLRPTADMAERMARKGTASAPKSIGQLAPATINPTHSWLSTAGNFIKRAVESLDPRELAAQGGRSVQHVTGDIGELARSVFTGQDTLSESPSARAYQSAGGGLEGVARAALPYVDVGTAILPTTRLLTPAGRAGLASDAAERLAQQQLSRAAQTATPAVRVGSADAIERAALPPSTSGMPRGVYAVDDAANGKVVLYQVDNSGTVIGRLEMSREPKGFTVGSLSAEPGSPSTANLLAGAKIIANQQFPDIQYSLRPSGNLSQYSRPLVEKLQTAGLIDPQYVLPPSRYLNPIDSPFGLGMPINRHDVPHLVGIPPEQIKDTTRELIKALARAKQEGRISADAAERAALPDRPTITMGTQTPARTDTDSLQRFIAEQRNANTPPTGLSQRDMDLLRYDDLQARTSTPDQLARNLEAMSTNRNPVTTQVDWSVVDPSRDVDLTRLYRNELEAQLVSPDAAALWTAQTAAKQGVNDFLIRNGLQSQLITQAPSYVNLRTLPNYISTQDWSSLMAAVPELRNYYVDVMRSYGIGL